jgi:hypothetical protein
MFDLAHLETQMCEGFQAVWDRYVERQADGWSLGENADQLRADVLELVGRRVGKLARELDRWSDCLSAGHNECSHYHESEG